MGATAKSRKPATRQQLIARIHGQLAGAVSPRDIRATIESHRMPLYHAGGAVPQSSTLADANSNRGHEVFSGLLAHMLGMAAKPFRRRIGDAVRGIDSTRLHVSGMGAHMTHRIYPMC